jgi:hypothetical protein
MTVRVGPVVVRPQNERGTSPLAGAEMMTFRAPTFRWAAAATRP